MTSRRNKRTHAERNTKHFTEPRYRRVLYCSFGFFLIVLACGFAFYLQGKLNNVAPAEMKSNIFSFMLLVFCGIGLITTAVRFRLSMTGQSITVRRAFWTRTMARGDIDGWQESHSFQGGTNTVVYLFSANRRRCRMSFPNIVEDTSAVRIWLNGIPYRTP